MSAKSKIQKQLKLMVKFSLGREQVVAIKLQPSKATSYANARRH